MFSDFAFVFFCWGNTLLGKHLLLFTTSRRCRWFQAVSGKLLPFATMSGYTKTKMKVWNTKTMGYNSLKLKEAWVPIPIPSIYGIFRYISHKNQLFMQVNIPVPWILWDMGTQFETNFPSPWFASKVVGQSEPRLSNADRNANLGQSLLSFFRRWVLLEGSSQSVQ